MITERDLQAAIAECQGERNPNANTCIKLAAYYTIKNEMYRAPSSYSYAAQPVAGAVSYESGTEFSRAIQGKDTSDVLAVIDELMQTIEVLNPRLYAGVMRKLR